MGFFSDYFKEAIRKSDEDYLFELERENERLKSEIEDYRKSTLFLRKQLVLLQNMLNKVQSAQVSDTTGGEERTKS